MTDDQHLSFGVFADAQHCDCDPWLNRYFRQSPQKLHHCIEKFNTLNLNFTVNLGDLIDRDFTSFERMLPLLKSSRCAVLNVLGNHDYSIASDKKQQVSALLSMPHRFYDYTLKHWRFIVLDGNDLSTFAALEPERKAEAEELYHAVQQQGLPQANDWNGGIGKDQIAWLQQRLDLAAKQQENVIIFCHYPVLPVDKHNLWNDRALRAIIAEHSNIVAYISGHNHQGNYAIENNTHFINIKGMVETEEKTAFATVDCFADHIKINGYGAEPSRELAFTGRH